MNQLRLDKVQVSFSSKGGINFEAINLGLPPVLVIRGDNGSGKTTLLNILSGHVQPRAGGAFLNDVKISGRGPEWAVKNGVVRGFQSPLLCNDLRAWENISLPVMNRWWKPASMFCSPARTELAKAGLDELWDRSPAELSFGQRRLVELLRIDHQISLGKAKLVLLDEPLAGLDPVRRAIAAHLIGAILTRNISVILVEHDHDLASFGMEVSVADIIVNNNGERLLSLNGVIKKARI